jgi:DNA-binding CsgD family transcriptional regulator
MCVLSENQLNLLSEGIRDLYSQLETEAVKRSVLDLIAELIGVDIATVDQMEPDGAVTLTTYPVAEIARVNALCPIFATFLSEHPSILAFQRREPEPVRLTDHVTMAKYRRTALYCEVYRPFGVLYQMNAMPPGETLKNTALTLHRRHRDFTEEERTILGLLGSHFAQAYSNALAFSRQARHRDLLKQSLSSQNQDTVFLNERGQPRHLSSRCQSWIAKYFPSKLAGEDLPELVRQWIQKSRTVRQQPGNPTRVPPLKVTRPEGSLELRWLAHPNGGELLLFLEKQSLFSSDALKPLGISARQAEVLRWMAEGKTDEEIGLILSVSAHTAHKHVQNIFKKMGVSNRATAVLRLCELSGLT